MQRSGTDSLRSMEILPRLRVEQRSANSRKRGGSKEKRGRCRERSAPLIASSLLSLFLIFHPGLSAGATGPSQVVIDFNGNSADNGIPKPWSAKLRAGRAEAEVVPYKGGRVLRIKCNKGSFSLERDVSVSAGDFPYLIWAWKAEKLPSRGDVRRRARNDQGLQVLIAFEDRKVISYIWDSAAPEGTVTDESIGWPFALAIKVMVVRSGEADVDRWVIERRNIYEDYEKMFHEKPSRVKGVRLQANTQYTKDTSEGFIGQIVFSRAFPDP
jgi:hypothetical protein